MRYIDNLKGAFGEPNDDFKNNVFNTLSALQQSEELKPRRKAGFRLSVIVSIVVIVAVTTIACAMVLSNAWGILDFLNGRRWNTGVEVSPEVIGLIEKHVPQESAVTALASFKVREGIFDGQNIYIVVEVKPASSDYLLLGSDAMPNSPVGNMGPQFESILSTIGDYAQINNKTPIHTNIYGLKVLSASSGDLLLDDDIKEMNGYAGDYVLEDDGTLVYMFNGRYDAADASVLELQLTCQTTTFNGEDFSLEDTQNVKLFFTLQNTVAKNSVASESPAVYSSCGVRVDRITLTATPMAIYSEIELTVVDNEKFSLNDNMWFEFVDREGNRLHGGAAPSGSFEPADNSGIRYILRDTIKAANTLPDEVILRGYRGWKYKENMQYDEHTFVMQ